MTRRYASELLDFIGPEKDVPAPDMNTNEQTMAWIMDTYSMHARHTVTAVVTGKPIDLGGSSGRREATGRGILFVINEAIKRFEMTPENTRSWSRVPAMWAESARSCSMRPATRWWPFRTFMAESTTRTASIFPRPSSICRPPGPSRIIQGVERVTNSELLELECDVLVPAATENQITSQNADRIKCKVLAEGANGPTTAAADEILHEKGIFVIPDILANAGGVTVSYFEWVQDRMGYFWREDVINQRLQDTMVASFNDLCRYADSHSVDTRTAAYMLAIDRVAYDTRMRGIYA